MAGSHIGLAILACFSRQRVIPVMIWMMAFSARPFLLLLSGVVNSW